MSPDALNGARTSDRRTGRSIPRSPPCGVEERRETAVSSRRLSCAICKDDSHEISKAHDEARCPFLGWFDCSSTATAKDPPRVLFLSKSSGFEHPSIARTNGRASHVDTVLEKIAAANNFGLVSTKDASLITAAELANLEAVVLYTTGDLTQAGTKKGLFGGDGETPMRADGVADLIGWVENGGALLGFHSAADTFHDPSGAPSP